MIHVKHFVNHVPEPRLGHGLAAPGAAAHPRTRLFQIGGFALMTGANEVPAHA